MDHFLTAFSAAHDKWLDHTFVEITALIGLGAFAALGFAPLYCWPFLVIAFVGLFKMMAAQPFFKALRAFTAWSFGFFLVSFYWVSLSMGADIKKFWFVLPFSLLGIPLLIALLHTAVFGLLMLFFRQHNQKKNFEDLIFWLVFWMAWTLSEWARAHFPGAPLPWNFLAHMWGDTLPVMQSASLIGTNALSFVTCGLFLLPALWTLPLEKKLHKARLSITSLLVGLFLLSSIWGAFRPQITPCHEKIFMRLVQPNISPQEKLQGALYRANHHKRLKELTRLPSQEPLTHILWPEVAFSYVIPHTQYVLWQPPLTKHQTLVAGFIRAENQKLFNSLFVISSKGALQGIYDKQHLAPFGEYVPGRRLLETFLPAHWIQAITAGGQDFSAGTESKTLSLKGAPPFMPLICFDTAFNTHIRAQDTKPQWLLELTNDAWFQDSWVLYQHLDLGRFRAIETGLPLVRVTNTGISALVSPYGQVLEKLPILEEGVLDFKLPKGLQHTWFQQTQNLPLIAGLFGLFVFLLWLTSTPSPASHKTPSKRKRTKTRKRTP